MKNTSWNEVSEWYDEVVNDKDSYQSQVILPNLLRLIAPHKGMNILDVACGQGFFSKALEVANIVGVDISNDLINIAKKTAKGHFFVGPSHKLDMVEDGTVDVAICILALQNIEKLNETIEQISKKLTSQGRFILVLNHPCFRIPKSSSWMFDGEKQYRRIDSYMSESTVSIDMHPGQKEKVETISFHRSLQVYFKALNKNGLVVSKLEEWISHKHPQNREEDRIRKEFPVFLMIECVKIN